MRSSSVSTHKPPIRTAQRPRHNARTKEQDNECAHHQRPRRSAQLHRAHLGFWPNESLVCITLDKGKVGATLRIDLPRYPGTELPYARTVSSYLTSDTSATSIVFAL
ncbi:DUF4192 family protein [Paenarthrobacter nitroguajacolicus]|uniref:DUF4192 family protein n=1 Tax=Paenarthrobacter nitroguajacolicus TaxID=211146 RepID=UPI00248B0D44|nr:DUF4192 family protein [Paenarthrobacter nitroguajacolicus]